jgi:uncharacterized membrane protein YhaH (DUF805 family)
MTEPTNPYAAPTMDWREPPTVRAGWGNILFSFEGRIPRRLYWASRGLAILPLVLAGVFGGLIGNSTVTGILIVPAYIAFLWIALAGSVKRWHDLNKSGWWVFVAMVPVIGGFWELIEAGCARGTTGPNRYGRDPT